MRVALVDICPPEADVPFDRFDVQEAPAAEGPWSTIGTGSLDPLDTNPRAPAPRRVEATSERVAGVYRVAWIRTADHTVQMSAAFALDDVNPTRVVRGVQTTAPASITRTPAATLRRT